MRSEGTRRLSLFLGCLGCVGWVVFVLIASEFFAEMDPQGWMIFFVGIPFSFVVPFAFVKGLAWVVDGFKKDK